MAIISSIPATRRLKLAAMVQGKSKQHWGEWIERRGIKVGFKRKLDFAKAIGCTTQNLARWIRMERPPEGMRRGLDDALARALKLDRSTLFLMWTEIDPEDVQLIKTLDSDDVPFNSERPEDEKLIRLISDALTGLTTDDLHKLLVEVSHLRAVRYAEFEEKLDATMRSLRIGPYTPTMGELARKPAKRRRT
jgi:hypothetical protein